MNYYAVERSGENELMHYGVKGMKWGVRKRIDSTGNRFVHRSPAYHKAERKLEAISSNNAKVKKPKKSNSIGKNFMVRRKYKKAVKKLEKLNENANLDYQRGQRDQMKEDQSRMFWWSDNSKRFTGLGLKKNKAVRIRNRIDGRKAKKLSSKRGHAKAVKKRDQYLHEMNRKFAGTKYAFKR